MLCYRKQICVRAPKGFTDIQCYFQFNTYFNLFLNFLFSNQQSWQDKIAFERLAGHIHVRNLLHLPILLPAIATENRQELKGAASVWMSA